ncbi:hypothetical protein DID80_05430 [Candidatus Marinamargulisbacteria bacterium SCGC AAA071-K20]|nr:hypothetical protein DID80_05430 [Candidatus Marinamargulisbacteria bacterium SCGC AAA071-K20]
MTLLRSGFLLTAIAVALNAFGHHILRGILPPKDLSMFDTAARYLLFGGAWVMIMGLAQFHIALPKTGVRLVISGLSVFCGSLFLYLLFHVKLLMFLTPIGGLLMIFGFLMLVFKRH